MPIPDFQSIMLPVLKSVSGGEVKIGDVVADLADELGLTPEDRTHLLPSGRQTTFANRVHWAKSFLAKAGLVELTGRGRFQITARGRDVLAQGLTRIDNRFLSQFEEFREFRFGRPDADGDPVGAALPIDDTARATPDETIRSAHARLEEELATEILQRVQKAPPAFFERLIVQLVVAMGYGGSSAKAGQALVQGRSGDGGVDGVIDQDALGLDRIYVQAKRYADGNTVGPSAIRDFFGSLDRFKAAKGLFVTTSTFTASAVETAELLSKRIVLIDGRQLAKLMIRFDVGCRVEETLSIKKVDEDFFE